MAMEQEIKDLGGLVNKDIGYSKLKQEYVYDSQNFRITTDEGGTLAVRTNIRGNDYVIEIPDTPIEYKFSITNLSSFVTGNQYSIVFQGTNSVTSVTSTITYSFIYLSQADFLTGLALTLNGPLYSGNNTSFFYNATAYVPDDYQSIIVIGDISSFTISSCSQITPVSVNLLGSVNIQITKPKQTGLKIIGWCTIRDVLYLLTTNANFDPDVTPPPYNTFGQWWRLSYDKTFSPDNPSVYTIKMVYNGLMNITIHRPVANPGMIESRYENEEVQKIYWTDNFNVPRQINVSPLRDNVTALLSINQLNLIPALNMEPPRITQIGSGGNLKMGVYQVAYRLKNLNLSETRFSRTSNLIPLIDVTEASSHVGYYPNLVIDGTNATSKALRVKVDNINTEYQSIEFVLIYYKDNVGVPEIFIVNELTIPDNGKVDFFIETTDDSPTLTIDEFTTFATAIVRCKTLAAKKQTLFLGNLTIADQEVDFDARTYRFPLNSNTTIIRDAQNISYTIQALDAFGAPYWKIIAIGGSPITPYDIPEDHDCIQDYNDQDHTSSSKFLYLPNSNVLGGEGPNLKYEFFTETLKLDGKGLINNGAYVSSGDFTNPGTSQTSFNSLGTTPYIADSQSFNSYLSPYNYGTYVGYMRDEMYRFGVVFYDVLDNPTYVNWIADIRMPHMFMPDQTNGAYISPGSGPSNLTRIGPTSANTPFSSAPAYWDGTANLFARPLGIKVEFKNLPTDIYQAASIVRVERKELDKHILGQGIMRPTFRMNSCVPAEGEHLFMSPYGQEGHQRYYRNYGLGAAKRIPNWWFGWTFFSPEFSRWEDGSGALISSTEIPLLAVGDKMDFLGIYKDVDNHWMGHDAGGGSVFKSDGDSFSDEYDPPGVTCGDHDLYHNIRWAKNYELDETNLRPHVVKNTGSQNAYDIKNIFFVDTNWNAGLDGIGNPLTYPTMRIHGRTATRAVTQGNNWGGGFNYGWSGGCDGQTNGWNQVSSTPTRVHDISSVARSLFVELDANQTFLNFSGAGFPNYLDTTYDGFYCADNTSVCRGYNNYIANYKRSPSVSYGGNTYFARSVNEYISCNNVIFFNTAGTNVTKVFGGDTMINIHEKVLDHFDKRMASDVYFGGDDHVSGTIFPTYCYAFDCHVNARISYFPVETSLPLNYRRARNYVAAPTNEPASNIPGKVNYFSAQKILEGGFIIPDLDLRYTEFHRIDTALLFDNKSIYRFFPKVPDAVVSTVFDCRIWRSEEKIDGELVESWSIYRPGEYKDVESAYGPLNNLIIFQDKMYFIQDKGFGTVQVKEQKLISDASGDADLVLGSTGLLERYDYISTKTGTRHQFSMSVSDYSMIWFDAYAKKLYRYKPGALEPVSDVKGYHGELQARTGGLIQVKDNPYIQKGIHSTYDYRHNEFIMTFLNEIPSTGGDNIEDALTLVYNDLFDGFVGEYTHYPVVYINDKSNFFSVPYTNAGTSDKIYVHNYGDYGVFYGAAPVDSKLSFIVNSMPTEEKVLTNFEFSSESYKFDGNDFNLPAYDDFFDTMRVYDSYQNTDFQPLANNARRHKSIWDIKVPSDRVLVVGNNASGALSIFSPANLDVNRPARTRRMKDRWFVADFTYDNSRNNKIILHTAKALYMKNSR